MPSGPTLVLGGTGFIGANVVRALLARGHRVRVMRRGSSKLTALEGVVDELEFVEGDVRDRASLDRAMRDARFVVDSSGYYPVSSLDVPGAVREGVTRIRNVLDAARAAGVERFAFTSTLSTIGRSSSPGEPADESDLYVPGSVDSAYFESKWAMESEVMRAAAAGLDAVVLCPAIVLGEWDAKPTSGRLVTLVANDKLHVFVEATVNVVHARDVGHGHARALERGTSGERYVLGGENLPLTHLFSMIAMEAGATPPRFEVSARTVRAASYATEVAAKAGWTVGSRLAERAPRVAHRLKRPPLLPLESVDILENAQPLSSEKARRELGYASRPARAAVRDSVAWFRERGYLRHAD